ncbi:ferric reductase-like transmembrane component [Rhexocercosporidium sp. MPI-PUGE-AT-0058]|nr:ferric reductase-like transmembrane component [Rhexocercosporidium sp. MPI-PUGE-AT-0058]
MNFSKIYWALCLLFRPAWGATGLVGFGIYPYSPYCAYTCLRSLDGLMLVCSEHMDMSGMMMHGATPTSAECRAGDTPWLTTLAWCLSSKCTDLSTSKIEAFWELQSTEDPSIAAKWSYTAALLQITEAPTHELTAADTNLNITAIVNPETYQAQWNTLTSVQRENVVEGAFGIAILVTGFGTPIILTYLGYVPYMSGLLDKVRPYLVYPSLIGTYQVRSLPYLLGNAPTVGQGIWIVLFFILNLILSAANYEVKWPHSWYASKEKEVAAYIFYRTGVFAFVLLPLMLLFSSRNNFLLWMTNWSHSTFLLLHRWVARIFALHVLIHSLIALPLYYPAQAKEKYWIWGAVATIAVMVLSFASGLYVRRFAYEAFLITHIVLSVFVVIGCWYHIKYWIGLSWGYETWLYVSCAVWFFDRLARVARILKTGFRNARITDLGEDYVRVEVPGIRWGPEPGKHVYAYFPTLNPLRPWENHPFSIMPSVLLDLSRRNLDAGGTSGTSGSQHSHEEKHVGLRAHTVSTAALNTPPNIGLTLFVKKSTGMTKYMHSRDSLITLLDGPYPNNPTKEILCCDRLLLIGGGIGITSILPWVAVHGEVKLCWSVKESARCLVREVDGLLSTVADKEIKIGSRLDFTRLLDEERETGWARVGVVVSGPGEFCDDVRQAVALAGRKGKSVFQLEVDAYSW